ncbi:hypothetical protein lerEdw1_007538 [Lerista edwardsae]|nr:hypothetical protein lerEdw1_007538 [Lerista edwardsae]
MAAEALRRRVGAAFRLRGLTLRADAANYLTEALQMVNEVELGDMIEKLIDAVEKQPLSCNMIEKSAVETAVQECNQSLDETMEHIFNIIGAFDIPRYIYNSERKKFLPLSMTSHPTPNLFGCARDKAELFRERYIILQQVRKEGKKILSVNAEQKSSQGLTTMYTGVINTDVKLR